MNLSEKELLENCKKAIEQKLNWAQDFAPKQRDFEFLLNLIEEKSKIRLSLSTIKRIWEKESTTIPQISTLNALAIFLDYSDWTSFKKEQIAKPSFVKTHHEKSKTKKRVFYVISAIVICLILAFSFFDNNTFPRNELADNISINVIIPENKQLPQTVILNYEILDTSLSDYYIKPYYDPAYTFKLDKSKNQVEFIYKYPGCYSINLISESLIIETFKVKIESNGWVSQIFKNSGNIYFNQKELIENGELVVKEATLVSKKELLDSSFYSGFYYTDKLPFIDGDNFIFETKIKCLKNSSGYPDNINIGFRNENFNSSFPLINYPSMYQAECKFGRTVIKNSNEMLKPLICDVYEWQKIRFEVKNRNFKIYLNNDLKYQNIYFDKAGELEGFCFVFPGLGAVDYVKVYNLNNELVYENGFE